MRPIYKSLALASTALQVSLALNAETRDDESASTIALQAELLDSLRVELVAQNVSGARNLIESGECIINGSNLVIALDTGEWTRGAMYRVQVLATFGTQTQVIYALNVTVPYYIALSDVPQEFEDNVTIVSTITDVTEADLHGLALEATSQEIKSVVNGQSQDLIALARNYDQLASDVQAIKDAHILGFSYDGLIFEEGYEPKSAFGIVLNRAKLIEVHDDRDDFIPELLRDPSGTFPLLEIFDMTNAVECYDNGIDISFAYFFRNHKVIRQIRIPTAVPKYPIWGVCSGCTELRLLDISDFNVDVHWQDSSNNLKDCVKLIDIVIGRRFTGSRNTLKYWSPTDALIDNSTSLLTQEDLDAGFTSNREMLLYNIREHIAANLPDRTDLSPFTITFHQTLRNAFDQATEDAFAAKNWDIAPARS